MFSLQQREQIVKNFIYDITKEFQNLKQYNIFIFGSFLTSDYTEDSDIDIGILSIRPGLTFRLYSFTKEYFDNLGIVNDVVWMRPVL